MGKSIDNSLGDKQFTLSSLREEDLDLDPFKQFALWFEDAKKSGFVHPNAFALATSALDGMPSVRMLLLKGFDERGFVFYTNADSKKGYELTLNPKASMCFWWDKLERQVRIEGDVQGVSDREADSYFATRAKGSQIGAWASPQSRVIQSRQELEGRFNRLEIGYENKDVPRPPYWCGYRLIPCLIEFWQGRRNRLHDRLRYRLLQDGNWVIERLAP